MSRSGTPTTLNQNPLADQRSLASAVSDLRTRLTKYQTPAASASLNQALDLLKASRNCACTSIVPDEAMLRGLASAASLECYIDDDVAVKREHDADPPSERTLSMSGDALVVDFTLRRRRASAALASVWLAVQVSVVVASFSTSDETGETEAVSQVYTRAGTMLTRNLATGELSALSSNMKRLAELDRSGNQALSEFLGRLEDDTTMTQLIKREDEEKDAPMRDA
ncbi:hypothetical protein PYCC9005_001434 [Savitreella phatthalungensis]